MFGQEPPTYFRSMAAVLIPFLANVQESNLPAAPLPKMRTSYSSGCEVGVVMDSSTRDIGVFMDFRGGRR